MRGLAIPPLKGARGMFPMNPSPLQSRVRGLNLTVVSPGFRPVESILVALGFVPGESILAGERQKLVFVLGAKPEATLSLLCSLSLSQAIHIVPRGGYQRNAVQ